MREWADWADAIERPRREAEKEDRRQAARLEYWKGMAPMSPEQLATFTGQYVGGLGAYCPNCGHNAWEALGGSLLGGLFGGF